MNPIVKGSLILSGTACVALGVLGIFLPLLPTTPFLLLAAACYVRSSDRLYCWLIGHRYLGPFIRNFRDGKGMPRRAKVYTLLLLWISLLFSMYRLPKPWIICLLVLTGIGTTSLILRMKTLEEFPEEAAPQPET